MTVVQPRQEAGRCYQGLRWPHRQAQRIFDALADPLVRGRTYKVDALAVAHADEWQCAHEVVFALCEQPTGTDPLLVLVIAESPRQVKEAAFGIYAACAEVMPDDPCWKRLGQIPRPSRRSVTWIADLHQQVGAPQAIRGGSKREPSEFARPITIIGWIDGAVDLMERVLTHERENGFGWYRSQEFLLVQLKKLQSEDSSWHHRSASALLLRRNSTHRILMDAGDDLPAKARGLLRTVLATHERMGTTLSRVEAQRLFGGQRQEFLDWLVEQIPGGGEIPSEIAATWMAEL